MKIGDQNFGLAAVQRAALTEDVNVQVAIAGLLEDERMIKFGHHPGHSGGLQAVE